MPSADKGARERLLAELQRTFTDALLRGDERGAEFVLWEAIEAHLPEAVLDDFVIAPALRAVGDLWAEGQISVADEHHATEIACRVVTLQRDQFRVLRRRPGRTVVLAAVRSEQHVVGLRMAGSLLGHAGYTVKQLGPAVPPRALGSFVLRYDPAVVGLTVTLGGLIGALEETVGLVEAMRPGIGFVLGGAAVTGRTFEQPGIRVCPGVGEVVAAVDALVQRAHLN